MIFDVDEANRLLNLSGISRNDPNEQDRYKLFDEISTPHCRDGFNPPDDDTEREILDFSTRHVYFEMKDLNFCLVDDSEYCDGPGITLHVSYRNDPSWDQHMPIVDIDDNDEWDCMMEQAWEYCGNKTIEQLREELETLGGTYDKNLEAYFV